MSTTITLKDLTDASEVVFDINDSAVTVSGNTVTLNPPADLLYEKTYAVQISVGAAADVSNNPFIGINDDTTWSFTTILANPIPNSGGPYLVPVGGSLSLNGSASVPSTGAIINPAGYSWDLNRDNIFGEVTGANPTAITDTVLMGTYGMVLGQNTIKLKITDSLGNTATATTIVKIGVNLSWDANGTGSGQTDGTGTWLNANQWRDNGVNTTWISGCTPIFGVGSAGGTVTLGASTPVGSLVFNSFTGTYTISGGSPITVNSGFSNNSAAGSVTITTPVVLGSPQTWTSSSTGSLTVNGGVSNGGHALTLDVAGTTSFTATASVIAGGGGLTKNGAGRLQLGAGGTVPVHTYTGTTTLNGGVTMVSNFNIGSGNLTLNGGVIESYWATNFTRALGTGAGQMQLTGGESGFSCNGATGLSVILGNSASSEAVWGTATFNPSALVLQAASAQANSYINFQNKIDLKGATRTIRSNATASGVSATISGVIRNSDTLSPAGLIKGGTGLIILSAANTYNAGTTVQTGTLQLGNAAALGSTSGQLTVNGGLLNLSDQTVSVGNLTGSGGTIANNGTGARTLTIGSGNGGGGNYQGVIANTTSATTGTVALTKAGSGTIALANSNTYTGATTINGGGTLVLTGATQATTAITFAASSSLGLVIGSPVTAASAAVNLSNGRVSVTGTPGAASHTLLTALSISGTPVLTNPVSGYELQVVGNEIRLVQTPSGNPYDIWAGSGNAFDADTNGDGVRNGLAWLLGAANLSANAGGVLPVPARETGKLVLTFRCLKIAQRGTAVLKVRYSNDLGQADPWTSHEAVVPDASSTVGSVDFVITADADPAFINVRAEIPASAASAGKLFGRLYSTEN